MKTITVTQLRQNPTSMLDDVEAAESYLVTRHRRAIARIMPRDTQVELPQPRRSTGSRLATLTRHELQTATSLDDLLTDERDR